MKSRTLASLAIVASAALALSACSGTPTEENTAPDSGTLTFANWQWLEPGRGEVIWDAVHAYTKEKPEVDLVKQEVTRADFEKTMSTQIGAGGGPDVMILPEGFYYTLADAGALEPLNGVLSDEQTQQLRANNDNFAVGDEQLALLWGVAPYTLFWNKQIIEAAGVTPPTDFAGLVEAAKTVTEKTGKTGFVVRHQMNEESAWWEDFSNWPYGFGGGWSDGKNLTIDTPENVAAVSAFKEIYSSGGFGVGDDASTYRSKFAAGEVGFVLDNITVVISALANNDVLTSDDIGSSLLPFPGGSSGVGGTVIAINANSKNKELAKDFVRFLFEKDTQESLADALFPAGIGTFATAPQSKIDANPWVDAFYKQLEDSQSVLIKGFETETPQISHIILTEVSNVLTSGKSPADALRDAQKEAEAAVK